MSHRGYNLQKYSSVRSTIVVDQSSKEKDRVHLRISREDAKNQVRGRLDEAEALVHRDLRTKAELQQARDDRTIWADFTIGVLFQIATNDDLAEDFVQ